MKKSELKNIIKECVKEVIFEEGVLSGIITEVATGLSVSSLVSEQSQPQVQRRTEARDRVLQEIGSSQNNYEQVKQKFSEPHLFEGTKPIIESGHGALAGVSPGDSGVDISNIPGFGNWGKVSDNLRK